VVNTTTATVNGSGSNDAIFARGGNDAINGQAGNDLIYGGAGDDTITQSSTQGRDFIDGGAGTDTFVLQGVTGAEQFQIMTRAAWGAVAGNSLATLHFGTEIVITRGGAVVAELDNIEEITVNSLNTTTNTGNGVLEGGLNGGDTISVVGDFTQTSLDYSTITVNGGRGNDVVDIRGLTSDHRVVLNTNGGNDNIVGDVRPQDVINTTTSGDPGDYVLGPKFLKLVGQMADESQAKIACGDFPTIDKAGSVGKTTKIVAAEHVDALVGSDDGGKFERVHERFELRLDPADYSIG
jgi:hypothetical protein